MIQAIDHIGIAVADLDEALAAWSRLGLDRPVIEDVPEQGVRVAMLPVGGGKIELLAPLSPDSPVGRFLERRGPGLHHVALRVDDIEAALAEAEARGLELIDRQPRIGAGGARIAFVHPRSTGGTLVGFCQR
ncbi:MAG: methylmalonyl-CoA epimerase [Bacillota bacterium]|nr:MAG: methylmalonyl-CoA epimerase [Bacillota bacterium]